MFMVAPYGISRRAQSSIELLIALGFGPVVLVPLIALALMQVSSSSSSLSASLAQGAASKLASAASAVGSQISPAKQSVLIQVMQNVYVGTLTNA